jgi:hypothetical protein
MPATIQLCVFEKRNDEPSGSSYCQKLETYFRACDYRDYENKFTVPFVAPKGKLPYIIIDNKPIADSHFIIRYLIREGKIRDLDADAGLTPVQRAESRAWQAYIDELIYPATVCSRFSTPENWTILKEEAFGKLPFFLKWIIPSIIYSRVSKGLIGHGVGRHTKEEVNSILEDYIQNLCVRLEASDGVFFHGKSASLIDCVVYGSLVNALKMRSNPELTKLILPREVLRKYISYCTHLWFPEYTGILEMVGDGNSVLTSK